MTRAKSILFKSSSTGFPLLVSNTALGELKVKPGIEVACLTDVGRHRENNEDSYLYWEPDNEEEFRKKGRLVVIADGMGGHEGGQEASRLAVATVRDVYDQQFSDPRQALVQAFAIAHTQIQTFALENTEFHGMGTTCTAIALIGHDLFFAHTGDSRLYLIRGSSLSRLTHDHSYVGKLVEGGIVSAEDAETHPQRHILTAALGTGREVSVDAPEQPVALQQGDTLALCTDGLWSQIKDQNLADIIIAHTPAEACQTLVNMALQAGGPDNITVQIVKLIY
jgi:PPM family protein phosphatase